MCSSFDRPVNNCLIRDQQTPSRGLNQALHHSPISQFRFPSDLRNVTHISLPQSFPAVTSTMFLYSLITFKILLLDNCFDVSLPAYNLHNPFFFNHHFPSHMWLASLTPRRVNFPLTFRYITLCYIQDSSFSHLSSN